MQAYLFGLRGDPFRGTLVCSFLTLVFGWFLLVMGVRLLARAANDDAEARELLAAVLGVFRMVPVPESVRRAASKVAGLDVVSGFE